MNNALPNSLTGKSNSSADGFALKYFKGYSPQFSIGGSFLLLSLPPDFNNYKWSGVKESVGSEAILVPDIDRILTAYSNECLPLRFTVEFIEFVNQAFVSDIFATGRTRLDYAVNLYIKICNLPLMINDDEIRQTLSFYFDNPFDLNLPFLVSFRSNLRQGQESLGATVKKYLDQLTQVNLYHQNKPFKISVERARQLIDAVNAEMEKDLNEYFINKIKGRAAQVKNSGSGSLTKQGIEAKELLNNPKVKAFLEVIKYAEAYKRVLERVMNFKS